MTAPLLTSLENLPDGVDHPTYDPTSHKVGIAHLGLGAFHKAHQAFYTDLAIESSGGDWRICGASMRDTLIPEQINAQNGLYTLITRSEGGNHARAIASIAKAISAKQNPSALLEQMVQPEIRIVSITVTEKGYGIDRDTGGVDITFPAIAHDLRQPSTPTGVIGFIVEALRLRMRRQIEPFTVLCCDNLPGNGPFVRKGVLDYANRVESKLAEWINQKVAFPSTMVDRITPAQTEDTLALAQSLTGKQDLASIETEPFHQWVIEDNFTSGRPDWDKVGAIFTPDVSPYEHMKLRMLNGAHSMLAYSGFMVGHTYVRDVMNDEVLRVLVARHLAAAAQTLPSVSGIDFNDYAKDLLKRFSNPAIAHETYQIATDGSQKMPQRIFEPVIIALEKDMPCRPFAFAAALWMHYCRGWNPGEGDYEVRDPIAATLISAARRNNPAEVVSGFNTIPGLIPIQLSTNPGWNREVTSFLASFRSKGLLASLACEYKHAAGNSESKSCRLAITR